MQRLENIATSGIEVTMRETLDIPYDETRSWIVPGVVAATIYPGLEGYKDSLSFELLNAQEAFKEFDTTPPTFSNGNFVPAYAVHYNRRTIGVFTIQMFELLKGEPTKTDQIKDTLHPLTRQLGETLAAFASWNLFRGELILDQDFIESCRSVTEPKESYQQFRRILENTAKTLAILSGRTLSQNERLIENGRSRSNYHPALVIRDLRRRPVSAINDADFPMEVIWGADLGSSPAKFSYRQSLSSFADLYAPARNYLRSPHQEEILGQILPLVKAIASQIPAHHFDEDAAWRHRSYVKPRKETS